MTMKHQHRKLLAICSIPQDGVAMLDKQLHDILGYHVESFNSHHRLDLAMKSLARDCYLQGLIDGRQLRPAQIE